jgi:DNA polymerase III subunit delta'
MTFDQLTLHKNTAEKLLEGLANDRVAHAQYFQGADGGGNLPLVVAYAHALLSGGSSDMFGGMDTRAARLEHPDLHLSFPIVQSASAKISDPHVQDFREAYTSNPFMSYKQWQQSRGEAGKKAIISKSEAESIAKKFTLKSYEGGRKVLLMWMPEYMNETCSNKLLKLIEEPPADTVIILVGTDAEALLPTIRSRIQVTVLPPLSADEIMEILVKNRSEDEDYLMEVAEQAEGSISYALNLLTEGIIDLSPQIIEWTRSCYSRNINEVMTWCDTQAAEGREPTLRLLERCLDVYRMAFRKHFIKETLSSDEELETFTEKFSPFIHTGNAEGLMESVEKAHADISRNGNVRIVLLDLSFQVMKHLKNPVTQN